MALYKNIALSSDERLDRVERLLFALTPRIEGHISFDGGNIIIENAGITIKQGRFTFVTADTNPRVRINSAGLQAWDNAGVQTVDIKSDGTFALKSAASGARLVFTPTTGLELYSASERTVWLDPDTGNATFKGTITADAGAIGGWTVGSVSLTGGDATLHSSGYLELGTANNIIRLDATDATYRLWIGNAVAASAPFRVSQTGEMWATNGHFTGYITAEDTTQLIVPTGFGVGVIPTAAIVDGAITIIKSNLPWDAGLCRNGSFEVDSNDDQKPDDWSLTGTALLDSQESSAGGKSLKCTN